jgi:hypothetical protein
VLVSNGLVLSGLSPDNQLVEIVELAHHPWFVGTQFHPEFKSRPDRPHPLFRSFIGAAVERRVGTQLAISRQPSAVSFSLVVGLPGIATARETGGQ